MIMTSVKVSQVVESVELKDAEETKSQEVEWIEMLPKKWANPLKLASKSFSKMGFDK